MTHLDMSPLELLSRLAALIPSPGTHLIRYHGVFANRSRYRSRLPVPPNLEDVCVVDSQIAIAVGEHGSIDTSIDGGLSWAPASTVSHRGLFAVACSGTSGVAAGYDGQFVYTTDSGDTWVLAGSGTAFSVITDVRFVSSTRAVACGQNGAFLSSTDAGATWTELTYRATNEDLWAVSFPSDDFAIAVGSYDTILSTTDAGETWTPITHGTAVRDVFFRDVCFTSATHGVAVGLVPQGPFTTGVALRTDDGGSTWSAQTMGSEITGVDFATALVGCAVGDNGAIWRTEDGGATWTAQASPGADDLKDIRLLTEDFGIAVGDFAIYRTTNGGGVWDAVVGRLSGFEDLSSVAAFDASEWVIGGRRIFVSTAVA